MQRKHLVSILGLWGKKLIKDCNLIPRSRWRGGWGPLWSDKSHDWHHPSGIVSCGDAAGLVDPLTGEGITAALISGEHAGRAVAHFLLENRNLLRLEEYSQWLKEHFARQYRSTPFRQDWSALCGF